MDGIYFKNQESLNFKLLVASAIVTMIAAIVLFLNEAPSYLSLTAASLSVILFAFTSLDNFVYNNVVNYDSRSVTGKLLGRKTFGFLFEQVQETTLSDKGLLIRVQGQDVITLSRKRYKEKSLQEFYNLINKNK